MKTARSRRSHTIATFFNVEQRPVNDLIDFANVLLDVQPNLRQCLVRGRLRSGHDAAYNVRRSLDPRKTPEPTFTEGRHYWLPVDVDDWQIPAAIIDLTRRQIVDAYITIE